MIEPLSKSPPKKRVMVYLKEHCVQGFTVLAICDENTLGKTFSNGRITITVTPSFYQGQLTTIPAALKMITAAPNCNLIGRKIVQAALKARLLNRDAILEIGETQHAQRVVI